MPSDRDAALAMLREAFPEAPATSFYVDFRGSAWRAVVNLSGVSLLGFGDAPDAAVDALLSAWRDAIRPSVERAVRMAAPAGMVPSIGFATIVARVLGEEDKP